MEQKKESIDTKTSITMDLHLLCDIWKQILFSLKDMKINIRMKLFVLKEEWIKVIQKRPSMQWYIINTKIAHPNKICKTKKKTINYQIKYNCDTIFNIKN